MKLFGEAPPDQQAETNEDIKKQRQQVKDAYDKLTALNRSTDDMDFYNVVIFGSHAERKDFLDEFGFEDNRYIDGRSLVAILKEAREKKP